MGYISCVFFVNAAGHQDGIAEQRADCCIIPNFALALGTVLYCPIYLLLDQEFCGVVVVVKTGFPNCYTDPDEHWTHVVPV